MSVNEFSIQKIILGSHLWLGFSAAVCTWGTFVLVHQPIPMRYLLFVLSGTMTIYSYHSFYKLKKINRTTGIEPRVPPYLMITLYAGSLSTLILYLLLNRSNQLMLLLPAVLALLYVFPIYNGKRLKDYPFIKIIAIVIAWTTITYWIPVHSIAGWWKEWGYNYLLIDRVLFFFALAIPFDIRDIKYDTDHSLKTIPNTIGIYNSQYLSLLTLFMAGGFMAMGSELLGIDSATKTGILLVYLLLGTIVIGLKRRRSALFYSWFIDGILFLYGLVVLILFK